MSSIKTKRPKIHDDQKRTQRTASTNYHVTNLLLELPNTRKENNWKPEDDNGISSEELDKYFGGISGARSTTRYNYICNKLAGKQKTRHKVKTISGLIMNI